MSNDTQTLLKVEQAARVLQVGRSKAYSMVADGSLPGVVRIGRSVRVSARRLQEWIDEQASPKSAA